MLMASVLPRAIRSLTQELSRLPGIGPKTAQRLAIHLLRQPAGRVNQLATAIQELQTQVRVCRRCFNLAEVEECHICRDTQRDQAVLCIVEEALDVEAIEKTETFGGVYHVLGGLLSPLEGKTEDQLTLRQLFSRLETTKEIILALDQTLEAEATSRHILERIDREKIQVTRLAHGLPTGGDIEFTDALTLGAALRGRQRL
jgi:recombination protein RecR